MDGAAVDSLVWEYFQRNNPTWTSRTRIIKRSEPYGIPPVVASNSLDPQLKEQISRLLLSMHQDTEGLKILQELMIDRFLPPRQDWYDGIRQLERRFFLPG